MTSTNNTKDHSTDWWSKPSVHYATIAIIGIVLTVSFGSVVFYCIRRQIKKRFDFPAKLTGEAVIIAIRQSIIEVDTPMTPAPSQKPSPRRKTTFQNHALRYEPSMLMEILGTTNQNVSSKGRRSLISTKQSSTTIGGSPVHRSPANRSLMKIILNPPGRRSSFDADIEPKQSVEEIQAEPKLSEKEAREEFFKVVDTLLDGTIVEVHEAYVMLRDVFIADTPMKELSEFWWRLAKATHVEAIIAESNGDADLRRNLVYSAFAVAEKALQLNDKSSHAHEWYGVTLGVKGDYLSISERIQNGFVFKKHIDQAVQLNPLDSNLHHLMGRFCFEVSKLSWFEKKLAATLFASPPTSTYGEALEHFQRAEQIKPNLENRLYLARCYIALGDSVSAALWLSEASKMPVIKPNDKIAHADALKLLPKYEKYL